jgi:glyoxylase-like metal-dependent hydrolase (beta-lactamase superfamily II)
MESSKQLNIQVYNASENSFHVNSVLVTGEKEAILFDAQFTLADAHRLVALILESGKELKEVFITFGDPDFYFGLEVIKQAFPAVKIQATAETIKKIKASHAKKLEVWGPKLGSNAPKNIIIPDEFTGDKLELEGQSLELIRIEGTERIFFWIPSAKTVIGSISVFGNLHLWTADAATTEKRQGWSKVLDKIVELNPERVIPGHAHKDATHDLSTVNSNLEYLKGYEEVLGSSKDSGEVISHYSSKYPTYGLGIALQLGAKVNKGEIQWG